MWFEYGAYLLFTLLGCLILMRFFNQSFRTQLRPLGLSVLITALIFILWDIWAVYQGHWSFNPEFIIGFFILNQPIEELLFFLIIPFFYLVCWKILSEEKP